MPDDYKPNTVQQAAGFYQKALLLKQQKRYIEAIELLQRAIDLNPNETIYPLETAICYLHLAHPRCAVGLLETLYSQNPEDIHIAKPYCQALIDSGNLEKAKGILVKISELHPNDLAIKALIEKANTLRPGPYNH